MISQKFLVWFDANKRDLPWRGVNNLYFTWLSEIMLQQTTVKTVIPYFNKFIAKWPKLQDLARADLQEVLIEWAGLGYYSRARNLYACAQQLNVHFPSTSQELIQLKGLGPYTSAAIAAICFNESIAVVDGNVERVVTRLFALEMSSDVRATLQPLVPKERAGDFAESVMELGATICSPKKPLCTFCPLQSECKAYAQGEQLKFPIKKLKPKIPEKRGFAFVVEREDGAVLLRTRPAKGLLGGMGEVPCSAWVLADEFKAALAMLEAPIKGDYAISNSIVRHVFTHFALELTIFRLRVSLDTQPPEGARFVQDFTHEALPTLFAKVLKKNID